jgi:trehalose 2-sulfotransferase
VWPDALIVCATPRSGTTLLCDLLAETGVTGTPNSFYRAESVDHFARQLGIAAGPDFERRYLDAITAEGRGATDLFSMRVMWPSMATMRDALSALFPAETTDAGRIATAFGTPLYLFVERKDKIAQAISRIKAEQSGLWHRAADGSVREQGGEYRAPEYDRAAIAASIAETTAHVANWRNWFDREGIAPMQLTYEQLSADPVATIRKVLSALGRDPSAADQIVPRTAKLADATSREWAERYVREAV